MASHNDSSAQTAELLIRGRYQRVARDPAKDFPHATLAAGAVIYRLTGGSAGQGQADRPITDSAGTGQGVEIAVVHRPRYDDWSLPKGKVDHGENIPQTAHREIVEETGLDARLEKLLGVVTYPVGDRTKVVFYWTASVAAGELHPQDDEVDELRWVPIEEAAGLLSYDVDAEVVAKAKKRIGLGVDTRMLLVRHGRAHQRRNWAGDDNLRPLDKKGRRQSDALVPMLSAFHPTALYAAEPDRCQQTAGPLARKLGQELEVDRVYGDAGWIETMTRSQEAFMGLATGGGVPVVFSQGIAIPEFIAWAAARGSLPLDHDVEAKKASCWVLSFSQGKLVGTDYLASPLAAR